MLSRNEVKEKIIEKFGDIKVETFDDGAFVITVPYTSEFYGDMVDYHIVQALDYNIAIHAYSKVRSKVAVWFTPYDEDWVEAKAEWQIIFPDYSKLAELGAISDFDELADLGEREGFEFLAVPYATCFDVESKFGLGRMIV